MAMAVVGQVTEARTEGVFGHIVSAHRLSEGAKKLEYVLVED